MSESLTFDIAIIGGGPAGYAAAIRAAQLGLKTACIERDKLGGICSNWGCIPTKTLLASAELYSKLKHDAADWGIHVDGLSHDWKEVIARSRRVADMGDKGVASLFKKHNITHVQGSARITNAATGSGACEVEVSAFSGGGTEGAAKLIKCKHVVIATGAKARVLPGAGAAFDGERIISSREAMSLAEQPKELLIVGAGAIGVEFAYFYNAFGTKVTIIEMLDRLLPIEDDEVSKAVERSFRKQGITAHTATKTLNVARTSTGVELTIAPASDETKTTKLAADKVLIAIGVEGNTAGVCDDSLGLAIEKHHIKVNSETYATNLPGVYAVGDVIGPPWLAHVASEEAIVCVERIAGHSGGHKPTPIDYGAIPGCTYCHPQVASIGLTERACKERNIEYAVGRFPLLASGKARALGSTEGFVKLITDKQTGHVLGCHMVGENVTELIAEIGLAMRLKATAADIIATMHAHPTLSESVHEAALGTLGRMIHF